MLRVYASFSGLARPHDRHDHRIVDTGRLELLEDVWSSVEVPGGTVNLRYENLWGQSRFNSPFCQAAILACGCATL
jgi:hypothetical protein